MLCPPSERMGDFFVSILISGENMSKMLLELRAEEEMQSFYEMYKDCMYLPSKEKYSQKVQHWLQDENIRVFVCIRTGNPAGMIVLQQHSDELIEIIGISVVKECRGQGIGSFLLEKAQEQFPIAVLRAETNDDVVVFYKKNGFQVTKIQKNYGEEWGTRYLCEKK